jgi:hypothetical protein
MHTRLCSERQAGTPRQGVAGAVSRFRTSRKGCLKILRTAGPTWRPRTIRFRDPAVRLPYQLAGAYPVQAKDTTVTGQVADADLGNLFPDTDPSHRTYAQMTSEEKQDLPPQARGRRDAQRLRTHLTPRAARRRPDCPRLHRRSQRATARRSRAISVADQGLARQDELHTSGPLTMDKPLARVTHKPTLPATPQATTAPAQRACLPPHSSRNHASRLGVVR